MLAQGLIGNHKAGQTTVPARTLPSLLSAPSCPYQLTKYGLGQLAELGSP